MSNWRLVVSVMWVALALLTSCQRTAPQSPSYRSSRPTDTDTALLALMQANQHLADAADRDVSGYIRRCGIDDYARLENGLWVRKPLPHDTVLHPRGQQVQLRIEVRRLDSTLLLDSHTEYTLGQGGLPVAMEELVAAVPSGDSVQAAAPWYAAYGAQGTQGIPPYENIALTIWVY